MDPPASLRPGRERHGGEARGSADGTAGPRVPAFAGGAGLASLGLAPPLFHVVLADAKGPGSSVDFGATRSDGNSVYARRETQVFTVASTVVDDLSREAEVFREPRLLRFDRGSVTQVDGAFAHSSYSLARKDAGWSLPGKGVTGAVRGRPLTAILDLKSKPSSTSRRARPCLPRAGRTVTVKLSRENPGSFDLYPVGNGSAGDRQRPAGRLPPRRPIRSRPSKPPSRKPRRRRRRTADAAAAAQPPLRLRQEVESSRGRSRAQRRPVGAAVSGPPRLRAAAIRFVALLLLLVQRLRLLLLGLGEHRRQREEQAPSRRGLDAAGRGAPEPGLLEDRLREVRVGEIRAVQVRPGEIRPDRAGESQVGLLEGRAREVRADEHCAREIRVEGPSPDRFARFRFASRKLPSERSAREKLTPWA